MELFPELINIIISFLPSITKRLISKYYFMPMSECEFRLRRHKNSLWYDDEEWSPNDKYWCLLITNEMINYISAGFFGSYYREYTIPNILINKIRIKDINEKHDYQLTHSIKDNKIAITRCAHIKEIFSIGEQLKLILSFK